MEGYVGIRAKQRKRKFFTLFIVIIIIVLFFFYRPIIDFTEYIPIPDDNILPKTDDEVNSLASRIEDLQIILIQKDQKIKFRDRTINSLQLEIDKLKTINKKIQVNYNDLDDKYNNFINIQNNKTTVEVEKNKIENLNEKLKNLIRNNEQNNILIGKLEDEINNLRNEKNIFLNDNEALKN